MFERKQHFSRVHKSEHKTQEYLKVQRMRLEDVWYLTTQTASGRKKLTQHCNFETEELQKRSFFTNIRKKHQLLQTPNRSHAYTPKKKSIKKRIIDTYEVTTSPVPQASPTGNQTAIRPDQIDKKKNPDSENCLFFPMLYIYTHSPSTTLQ